jgi:hypothetical protein
MTADGVSAKPPDAGAGYGGGWWRRRFRMPSIAAETTSSGMNEIDLSRVDLNPLVWRSSRRCWRRTPRRSREIGLAFRSGGVSITRDETSERR